MTYSNRKKKSRHNPVAKFMHRYNKSAVFVNKKKAYKRKSRDNKLYEEDQD